MTSPSSVHGPPQILPPPLNIHEHFVQIPGVAHAAQAVAQAPRVVESERQSPLPNCLIRDSNAALGEKIFDISETQAEQEGGQIGCHEQAEQE
jgi:hypothetical protein